MLEHLAGPPLPSRRAAEPAPPLGRTGDANRTWRRAARAAAPALAPACGMVRTRPGRPRARGPSPVTGTAGRR